MERFYLIKLYESVIITQLTDLILQKTVCASLGQRFSKCQASQESWTGLVEGKMVREVEGTGARQQQEVSYCSLARWFGLFTNTVGCSSGCDTLLTEAVMVLENHLHPIATICDKRHTTFQSHNSERTDMIHIFFYIQSDLFFSRIPLSSEIIGKRL